MTSKMIFTPGALPFVLKMFNKHIDGAGYIADVKTGDIAEDWEGVQLTEDNFGGMYDGKFYRCDLFSIMTLSEACA